MMLQSEPAPAEAALRALPSGLLPLAQRRLDDEDPRIRAAALGALARHGDSAPISLTRLIEELDHPDAAVRSAAVIALASRPEPEAQVAMARALADSAREVRRLAALEVSRLGARGVELAVSTLDAHPVWGAEAALWAVAHSGSANAQTVLVDRLRQRCRQAWAALQALSLLPQAGDFSSRLLRAACEDALIQNRKLAFRILELIEDPVVVRTVEKVLLFEGGRLRAAALEVLSHLGDREATQLLVSTLELDGPAGSPAAVSGGEGKAEHLEAALVDAGQALNRWIRAASAAQDGQAPALEIIMERLLSLRKVSLFSQMSLDQLETIDGLMIESQFLANEVIFREGDPGSELYLIIQGTVDIVKDYGTDQSANLSRLGEGSCFGEIAVLDESPRSATAVAAEDCTVLGLGGDRFKELIYDMPEIAFAIFGVLTGYVRRADERVQQALHGEGAGI
jgi:hypothetical protein